MKKYDVGIFGLWYGHNYGSIITYYALSEVIRSMGYSFAMIKNPLGANIDVNTLRRSHSIKFAAEHYDITPLLRLSEMNKLNESIDRFVLGSDQMWNYGLSKPYKQSYFFDFVNDDKIKIAYATSFGKDKYTGPDDEKIVTRTNLERFSAISVRDYFSHDILSNDFGVKSDIVLDPVFLCPVEKYDELIAEAEGFSVNEKYYFAYILDPNETIGKNLEAVAKESGRKIIVVFNEGGDKEKLKAALNVKSDRIEFLTEPTVQEWLYLYKNAEFVLTDSFHGTCFSIIFRRPFIVLKNVGRGGNRFPHLLRSFGLLDRMIERSSDFYAKYMETGNSEINYDAAFQKCRAEREMSLKWFEAALAGKDVSGIVNTEKKVNTEDKTSKKAADKKKEKKKAVGKNVNALENRYDGTGNGKAPEIKQTDIKRCQILASLLRDYGVKNVVLSSGTRHMHLVNFFEANTCFNTYNVIDERSAAFFAIGIATRLQEPVAICCTSGTAAANYLSACEEAFYQHVPLIILTTDRYEYLLNQREDQMIPQKDMFGSVCLKSSTLPIADNSVTFDVTRRMICETILEATHSTPGPVHINVPIQTIVRQEDEIYDLDNVKYEKIERYFINPDKNLWEAPAKELMEGKKVLILYGQAHAPSKAEKKAIENFAANFNCVFLTDHLSNMKCSKSVYYYNMTKESNLTDEKLKELKPDIVITMNAASVGFITSIVRKSKAAHWDIAPNGVVADPYKRITKTFECTPVQFFKRMNTFAKEGKGDTSFYDAWKKNEIPEDEVVTKYIQRYAVYNTLKRIPSGSLLHISNSNTIRMTCSYTMNDDIEVYCNRGTNGIDGSASTFMGQAAVSDKLCFLMIGDLSFFYDMNSLWNKELNGRIRIILFNNSGADMLRRHKLKAITHVHDTTAEGWVKSLGFTYLSSSDKEEFDANIERFVSDEDTPMFFEVFC